MPLSALVPRSAVASALLVYLLCKGANAQSTLVFEVASIKPSATPQGQGLRSLREDIEPTRDTLVMRNVALGTVIRWAYRLGVYELTGPDFISQLRFDINAKAEMPAKDEEMRQMLKILLRDRFHLALHTQQQDVPGYALVTGKQTPKLQPAEGAGEGSMTGAGMVFEGHKMPLSRLTDILSSALKFPVKDQTGLDGHYDFKLDLRPFIADLIRQPGGTAPDLAFIAQEAIESQLGLKLESRKLPMQVTVVDQVDRAPSEN